MISVLISKDLIFAKGTKVSRRELKGKLWMVRINSTNSAQFFQILQRAGYIEVRGRNVVFKKTLRLK